MSARSVDRIVQRMALESQELPVLAVRPQLQRVSALLPMRNEQHASTVGQRPSVVEMQPGLSVPFDDDGRIGANGGYSQ